MEKHGAGELTLMLTARTCDQKTSPDLKAAARRKREGTSLRTRCGEDFKKQGDEMSS